jgi:protein-L-isoaspartate(D-aspartate) O-methyltransferase
LRFRRIFSIVFPFAPMIPFLVPLLLGFLTACRPNLPPDSASVHRDAREDPYAAERARMVQEQVRARGVRDRAVLAAMARVPRHQFVPASYQHLAYRDHPLPIGLDQTISQPYIVAYMTEAAAILPGEKVLEIGTGSGYQAAVLAELAREVYTIEILPELATGARSLLRRLGYTNVQVRTGDGYEGWEEHAPFDAILVTAAPDHVPPALVEQLAVNGRMVIPVGGDEQVMRVLTKTAEGVVEEDLLPVRFVPLVRPDTARQTPLRR